MKDFLLRLMLGHPTMLMLYLMNVVLSSSRIYAPVKIFGACVSLPQVGHSGTLLLPGPLKNRQAYNSFL